MLKETNTSPHDQTETFLRRHEVEKLTGLGRSTIYLWMRQGHFPRPFKIGPRAVAWKRSSIQAWMDQRGGAA
ncbi:hypothetical protein CF392_12265 [Tamilnaduibacter salinus]|uniref:AlpA family transcriptional regulator n=1 Tax=Tamilnaduibacter salinus TaxID=1484056 RepID=A0A2A2I242_9GAMM|nr:hypothetical protein CF392_12265 [Tamilnaduibacter salinus]